MAIVRILGIDPGSHKLGVGCLEKNGNTLRLQHARTLVAPRSLSLFSRLEVIGSQLNEVLDRFAPHEVAVEDIFFARSVRSAITLGTARGIAIGACLGRGVKVFEYAPTQVKSVVTGYGQAAKSQVHKMVQLLVQSPKELQMGELGLDATDAIAIAICHASQSRLVRHPGLARQLDKHR